MASYLEDHILTKDGPLISAPWRTGLGHIPLGFSTYAPNSMEVAHRVLKGMLDPGYQRRDVRTLLKEVCTTSVATKVEKGDYKDLQSTLPEPWNDLLQSKRAKQVVSGKDDTGQQQKARLLGMFFFSSIFELPDFSRNSAEHGFEVLGYMGLTWIGCVSCLFPAQSVQTERFLR